jgi:hypothetical protein
MGAANRRRHNVQATAEARAPEIVEVHRDQSDRTVRARPLRVWTVSRTLPIALTIVVAVAVVTIKPSSTPLMLAAIVTEICCALLAFRMWIPN